MCADVPENNIFIEELFPIEETSAHWYIRQDGSRKIFVRCSANVLRANNGGGKHKPASTITT